VAGVLAITFVALLWAGFLALIPLAMLANWRDKRKRKRVGIPRMDAGQGLRIEDILRAMGIH